MIIMDRVEDRNVESVNKNLETVIANFLIEKGQYRNIVLTGIAGIGASGKSTLTQNIVARLGVDFAVLQTDDYLIPRVERRALGITIGDPTSTKLSLLSDHLKRIKKGETFVKPLQENRTQEFIPKKFVMVEGTWALTESSQHLFDLRIYIECDVEITRIRRFVRDTALKGYTHEQILSLLYLRQGQFDANVAPNKKYADIILRSCPDCSLEVLEDKLGLLRT